MLVKSKNNKIDKSKSIKILSKIIAVGASAEGLQALKTFFSNIPSDSLHTYVIIQHLLTDFDSIMIELLKRDISIPIINVVDDTSIKPGHIYLISPKKNMQIIDRKMRLFDKPTGKSLNLPIDIFFKSLAVNYEDRAVGVILSGTGSDGSKGVKAIKEHGGIVVVQKPETAGFDGMPISAIKTGYVDLVLPIEKMNDELEFVFKQDEYFKNSLVWEELKKSEQKFKLFYEKDPVMHFSIDPNTDLIKECNETAVKRLGFSKKSDLLEKPIFELYDSKSKEKGIHLINQFSKEGKLESEEITMITKKGESVPVLLNSEAIRDNNGVIIGSRSTAVDISALKSVQEELKEQKANLLRVNEDLEQFVSICSHDLQEPLGTITLSSELLNEIYGEKLDEKGRDYINYINQAAHRLSDQIKALLEHSRIGKNAIMEKVDLQEVLEVVKYDLGSTINKSNAKIYSDKLPTIRGYKVELRLLFQNLIGNAIKYCKPDTPPEVRVSAYKDGGYWVFSITDNGIGINKRDQKTIFDIFNRSPDARDFEGTGVGLAHCLKIVTLHEGSIWVESQFGLGSTFQFKLKNK